MIPGITDAVMQEAKDWLVNTLAAFHAPYSPEIHVHCRRPAAIAQVKENCASDDSTLCLNACAMRTGSER